MIATICAGTGATGIPAVCWLGLVDASAVALTTTGSIAGAALTAAGVYIRRH
ncbi:hypothetical protein [Cryptosporangium aurantiacum]|uniref:hypothetical protein n=1 Tax=Cryptosporangium aurantiacum TaxID=134849 RepID=UPI0015B90349|nr:hypothetical protein [Cryptosporangium aurantiacum]